MIRAGRVVVDGAVATIGQRVDPTSAEVRVDGKLIPVAPGLIYYLLYKPVGVVSTASDEHGRQTVVDLVPSEVRVYPVGRLDRDSEGLLLLTNDGVLTNRLTHPTYGVPKTYVVRVAGSVSVNDVRRFVDGVELEDGPAAALSSRVLDRSRTATLIEVVMGEGRNREVRRMADAIGLEVTSLTRVAIGPLVDRKLEPGAWRALTGEEVRSLYAAGANP